MDFRSKPGFTSSPPRIFMFGITTLMFALAIIALVLGTTTTLELAHLYYSEDAAQFPLFPVFNSSWAIITCLMVRLHNTFLSST
jgi:hypothetical protein